MIIWIHHYIYCYSLYHAIITVHTIIIVHTMQSLQFIPCNHYSSYHAIITVHHKKVNRAHKTVCLACLSCSTEHAYSSDSVHKESSELFRSPVTPCHKLFATTAETKLSKIGIANVLYCQYNTLVVIRSSSTG